MKIKRNIFLWAMVSVAIVKAQVEDSDSSDAPVSSDATGMPTPASNSSPDLTDTVDPEPPAASFIPEGIDLSTENGTTARTSTRDVDPSKCQALKQWYDSLNGKLWLDHSGWDSTDMSSCCSWYNVYCNSIGQILKIDLASNNLVGQLPNNLDQLIELQSLDLSNNSISGTLPKSFDALLNLKIINLDKNQLAGHLPESFGNFVNLTSIHMRYNVLTGTIPNTWTNLKSLQAIYLSNNSLGGPFPAIISEMPSLSELYLDGNSFNGALPINLGGATNLAYLNLRGNRLHGTIPSSISNMTKLQSLIISRQSLNGTIPEELYSLTNLQTLDLSSNRLRGSLSHKLGNLLALKRLNLGHNFLTGPIPAEIEQLKSLESIALNYNALNGQFPSSKAPPALGYCYMTPNQFQTCPERSIITNPESLAYQCSVDCPTVANKTQKTSSALFIYMPASSIEHRLFVGLSIALATIGRLVLY